MLRMQIYMSHNNSFLPEMNFPAPDSAVFSVEKTCFRLHKSLADKAVCLLSAIYDPTGSEKLVS